MRRLADLYRSAARPRFVLPRDPEAAARVILKSFQDDALMALIRGLADRLGSELMPKVED